MISPGVSPVISPVISPGVSPRNRTDTLDTLDRIMMQEEELSANPEEEASVEAEAPSEHTPSQYSSVNRPNLVTALLEGTAPRALPIPEPFSAHPGSHGNPSFQPSSLDPFATTSLSSFGSAPVTSLQQPPRMLSLAERMEQQGPGTEPVVLQDMEDLNRWPHAQP